MSKCLELDILDAVSLGQASLDQLVSATSAARSTVARKVSEMKSSGWLSEDNDSLCLGDKPKFLYLREVEAKKAAAQKLIAELSALSGGPLDGAATPPPGLEPGQKIDPKLIAPKNLPLDVQENWNKVMAWEPTVHFADIQERRVYFIAGENIPKGHAVLIRWPSQTSNLEPQTECKEAEEDEETEDQP